MITEFLGLAETLHQYARRNRLSIDNVTEQYKLTYNRDDFVAPSKVKVLDRLAELKKTYNNSELVESLYGEINQAVRVRDNQQYDALNSLVLTEVALLTELGANDVIEQYTGLRQFGFNPEEASAYTELALMHNKDHWAIRRVYANLRDWGANEEEKKEFSHLHFGWGISLGDIKHKHMEILEAEYDVGMKPYDGNDIANRVVKHYIENHKPSP